MESIEHNNEPSRYSMEEWRDVTSGSEMFQAWLDKHGSHLNITSTTAQDGRIGNFTKVSIDGEMRWISIDDLGTILEDESITFWNLD